MLRVYCSLHARFIDGGVQDFAHRKVKLKKSESAYGVKFPPFQKAVVNISMTVVNLMR